MSVSDKTLFYIKEMTHKSEEVKLNHLLNELTLDDRTPRQLLREMKQLGGDKVGSELLKSLLQQRLPERILSCMNSGSLELLSTTADKVHEVDELKAMVTTLADAVTKLVAMVATLHLGSKLPVPVPLQAAGGLAEQDFDRPRQMSGKMSTYQNDTLSIIFEKVADHRTRAHLRKYRNITTESSFSKPVKHDVQHHTNTIAS